MHSFYISFWSDTLSCPRISMKLTRNAWRKLTKILVFIPCKLCQRTFIYYAHSWSYVKWSVNISESSKQATSNATEFFGASKFTFLKLIIVYFNSECKRDTCFHEELLHNTPSWYGMNLIPYVVNSQQKFWIIVLNFRMPIESQFLCILLIYVVYYEVFFSLISASKGHTDDSSFLVMIPPGVFHLLFISNTSKL